VILAIISRLATVHTRSTRTSGKKEKKSERTRLQVLPDIFPGTFDVLVFKIGVLVSCTSGLLTYYTLSRSL
jgi:hypothetical protein